MSFMSIEVSGPELWILLVGPFGSEVLPASVCGSLPDYDETVADCPDGVDPDDYYKEVAFDGVAEYTENVECYEIEERIGYGARLSASGYLDCTPWSFHETEQEAYDSVCEDYDYCRHCDDSNDECKCLRFVPGDRIVWNDPDNAECSREITIATIEKVGDMLRIVGDDGSFVECLADEIAAAC